MRESLVLGKMALPMTTRMASAASDPAIEAIVASRTRPADGGRCGGEKSTRARDASCIQHGATVEEFS